MKTAIYGLRVVFNVLQQLKDEKVIFSQSFNFRRFRQFSDCNSYKVNRMVTVSLSLIGIQN